MRSFYSTNSCLSEHNIFLAGYFKKKNSTTHLKKNHKKPKTK